MSGIQTSPRSSPGKLPAGPPGEAAFEAGGAMPGLPAAPINILIVDDEPKNLVVLETVLDDPAYRLVRARSADEALLALIADDYALLILDIRMPGMTGFELADMIKQRKKTAQVPIIFLTAYYNEDQHVLEGYGSGAVDYLHKPVNPAVLRSKVAIFADLHRKSRELGIANRALLTEVAERRNAQAQLRELNETLEQRVADRTEALRQIEESLREAGDKKDKFIAILAHELRNPLAPIRNAVNVIHCMGTIDPQLAWCRDVIDRQVTQMTHLLEDLLDVSRITRTKLTLRREPLDLAAVVEQAIEIAQPFIEEAGQKLTVTLPPEVIMVNGDLTRLAQVISNLLINAAKYSHRGDGQIALSAERDADVATIRVKDNGIGIAAENMPHIFEMFGQVESALKRSQGGLGIGLALSKALIEMHDGSIRAYSEGTGSGSEFVLRMPITNIQAAPKSANSKPAAARPVVKYRILIADDLRDNADSLALLLQAMGNDVAVAYGGEEAVRMVESFAPDVVFLDLGMPDVDGYEACRRIRAHAWGRDVVVIALTGWGEKNYRRRTNEAGFDHHIVKPLDAATLEGLLETLARE